MARLLVVSCLVACCAALQPSLILSARTAQAAQRTAAPVMKRPDYFLRVSRSEAGRPRLCVFRWAVATTNPRWIGRLALVGCLHPWLCASHTDAQQQLSFPPAGRPHRLPPLLSSSPVPRSARQFSQVAGRRTGIASLPHLHTHNTYPRTKEPASVARAVLPLSCPSSPRVERSHAGRVVRAGRTRTSTRRSSTTARASSSAPPPPRRRAWTPPPPTVHHAPSPYALTTRPHHTPFVRRYRRQWYQQ